MLSNVVSALRDGYSIQNGRLEDVEESLKGAAEENRILKERLTQLTASHQRAIDESAALSRSLKREQEDKAVAQQSLCREEDEKGRALSRNEQLTRELEGLKYQLEINDIELRNLQSALQREEESSRGAAEENHELKEEIVELRQSHQRDIDEFTTISQLLIREQQNKAAMQQSLRQEEDENGKAVLQIQRLTGELDGLRRQAESHEAELRNLRGTLQHERESSKEAAEENRKLNAEVAQLRTSHQRAADESAALSQLLEREQEDKTAAQQSMLQAEDERGKVLSQNQQLMEGLNCLIRQLESKDAELENLRNELRLEQRWEHEKKLLEGAEKENRKLKEQLTQLTASHRRTVEESAILVQSLEQALEDVGTIQQSLRQEQGEKDKALSQSQRLIGELDSLRRQLENKNTELKNLRNEHQHSQRPGSKKLLKAAEEEIGKLKRQLGQLAVSQRKAVDESTAHLQMERGKLSALLEARSRELKGAQVHFIKPDTLSAVEVIALIDALNVEILQTSALISDSFDFACQSERAGEIKEASARTSKLTGATLARLLGAVLHADDPLLVQIALQGVTVEFSRRIIMSWDLDSLQVNRPLATLYNSICETETQAVGGRWRALTRAHAQKVALQGVHATMVDPMSDALVSILVAAGCTKSYKEIHQMLTQNYGERISNIVKMALRLNKALGEEVTSVDLESISVTSGEKFDEATMANFESYGEDLEGQIVLCTSALGLQKSEKVVQGDIVQLEVTTLLKPKVVLESVADDLDMNEA